MAPPETKKNIQEVLGGIIPLKYKNNEDIKLYKGTGCNECNNTGYLGRIAIFEIFRISPTINKLIIQHTTAKEIKDQARAEGLMTMKQDGYLKCLDGVTTIEEVLRVAESG